MAPLYKRYIPPKPSEPTLVKLPAPQLPQIKAAAPQDAPIKRKRERTDEEVAERKAKKLRKKGIDPTGVATPQASTDNESAGIVPHEAKDDPLQPSAAGHQSDFAHVTNKKKQRKLEKQARQQRKAAVQVEEVQGLTSKEEIQRSGHPAGDKVEDVTLPSTGADADVKPHRNSTSVSGNINGNSEESQEHAGEVSSLKKKGRQKKTHPDHTDDSNPNEKTIIVAPVQDSAPDRMTSQPKKRRHKLEHVLQDTSEAVPSRPDDEHDHLKKHSSIMKKFQQASKTPQDRTDDQVAADQAQDEDRPKPTLVDLAPLPQPEPATMPEFVPDAGAVPSWISQPDIVLNEGKVSFDDLQLDRRTVEHLGKLGFQEALPVQRGLVPLLLPPGSPGARFARGSEPILPDLAVSAPTGSGKTIAYLLPIIESLKKFGGRSELRALITVPTRELVTQVAAVADSLARGTHLKVGMATGTGSLKDEQAKLIHRTRRYDPAGWRALVDGAYRRDYPPEEDAEGFDDFVAELNEEDPKESQRTQDAVAGLPDHVPLYQSTCDILVATPGRLVEHLNNTLGFSLAHLQWLVLDEADKLLDLQYNDFLDRVNEELSRPHSKGDQNSRERYLRAAGVWQEHLELRVRKVVLSATMTSDISKLVALRLFRPRMLVVRELGQNFSAQATGDTSVSQKGNDSAFELPSSLDEFCVHVGDGSEKPLYLVELLQSRILNDVRNALEDRLRSGKIDDQDRATSDDSSSSEEDSSSDSDSSSSDDDSDSDDSQSSADAVHADQAQVADEESFMHPSRSALVSRFSLQRPVIPTILIFTSSNESTNRLSHLLKELNPPWSPFIASMTRSEPQRKALPHGDPSKPLITVATDRAARGLDALGNRNITHVIQYDVPRSTTAYVHRVGRTARAGRHGETWTLFTHSEARWFTKDIAKTKKIKRVAEVEKVKLHIEDDDVRERLSKAVERMRDEVYGGKT